MKKPKRSNASKALLKKLNGLNVEFKRDVSNLLDENYRYLSSTEIENFYSFNGDVKPFNYISFPSIIFINELYNSIIEDTI